MLRMMSARSRTPHIVGTRPTALYGSIIASRYNARRTTNRAPHDGARSVGVVGVELVGCHRVGQEGGLLNEAEGAVVQHCSQGVGADTAGRAGDTARRDAARLAPTLTATGVDDQHA